MIYSAKIIKGGAKDYQCPLPTVSGKAWMWAWTSARSAETRCRFNAILAIAAHPHGMRKAIALTARPSQTDTTWLAVLRFVLVSGCATALILARYPLPF